MDFFTIREMRSGSRKIWDTLNGGDEAVITNNGKPSALMLNVPDGRFEDMIKAVRQAKAMIALAGMRRKAADSGYMTYAEIEDEIGDYRLEMKARA
ncbi:MAG: hypothetical protein LBG82_02315 [Clostridiales Family XIII bacterium]|nr:hypothetical protein [Clostridiales Family XIII bacterium]